MDNDIGTVIESAFSIQVPLEAKGIQRATRRACNASIEASEFRPGIGDSETSVLPMVASSLAQARTSAVAIDSAKEAKV
jgi:hypothetical protein